MAQKDKIEGERKLVTVMFCDMAGFTSLSEKIGPENAYGIMDQIYEILISKVHHYEGTVNEMTGDGIMALFGAPIAYEDAPQRAIRASLSIHREVTRFNDRMQRERIEVGPIKMRIGIHTGPVVVGALGNDLHVEFKAVGDTVNLASRMEGLAQPGSTFVTEATYTLTEGLFRYEALGEFNIKGKTEKVKAYRVIAPSSRRTRFDVNAERGLTPFVGRKSELELLLDSFERIKSGRGQVFSIISEAGLGKTRLLYEFRKAIANEDVMLLEGKCLSFSKGIAYYPVIDILKSIFNISDDDPDSEINTKLAAGLEFLGVDEQMTLPYLLELFSVKDSGLNRLNMSPDACNERITEALRMILIRGAHLRPLVIAIEDLHWVDQSSADIFKYVLESIPGSRILLIFTYRPEYLPQWGVRSYHNQLTINRLSNRHVVEMMTHLLGTAHFDAQIEELILDKAEGVPFFIEEFINSLKHLKIIAKNRLAYNLTSRIHEVTIPTTIQDIIMARIDSLPHGSKEILQLGAVIEREFSYILIRKISGLSEQELFSSISILKDSELIYERGIYPRTTYVFKHALTREVVYESILAKKRKTLHQQVGLAIEDIYQDDLTAVVSVLADHFDISGDYEKSAEYARLASKKAQKRASLNDAIGFARQRVDALEKLDQNEERNKKILDARTSLGLYTSQTGRLGEAKDAISPIMELAIQDGDQKRLAQIYTILGTHSYMFEEGFDQAFQYLHSALDLAEEVDEIIVTVLANYYLGIAYTFDCQFGRGVDHIQRAQQINASFNHLWGMSVMQSHLSLPLSYNGQIRQAIRQSEEAVRLAEESGDIFSKAMAYSLHGISCYHMGKFQDAIDHLVRGADFGDRMNYFAWNAVSQFYLGESHFEGGQYRQAITYYEQAIWFLKKSNWLPSLLNLIEIALTRTRLFIGEEDTYYNSRDLNADTNRLRVAEGQLHRNIGTILLHGSARNREESEKWFQRAIELDKRNGTIIELGKDYLLLSAFFTRKGDSREASRLAEEARSLFREAGAHHWVTHCDTGLPTLV
ncbi:MAG: adenylate/guanylate cyclase domain-containing protein [Desulfobacterales bacterium]